MKVILAALLCVFSLSTYSQVYRLKAKKCGFMVAPKKGMIPVNWNEDNSLIVINLQSNTIKIYTGEDSNVFPIVSEKTDSSFKKEEETWKTFDYYSVDKKGDDIDIELRVMNDNYKFCEALVYLKQKDFATVYAVDMVK